MSTFFEKLEERSRAINSLLCVGLDPDIHVVPGESAYDKLLENTMRIVEATKDYALCFKPNAAFFEAHGSVGYKALEDLIEAIPQDIPVLLDSKRNDIGNTAAAYAQSIFGLLDVEATTLSPYMGRDAVDPFLKWEDKGLFLLCRTTNPGAPAVQDLQVDLADGSRGELYLQMAAECTSWSKNIGLVVAGNDLEALRRVRSICPDTWFLSPGIGSQGGNMDEAVAAGQRSDGLGIIPNVSRALANAEDPKAAAKDFCDKMNAARDRVKPVPGITLKKVLKKEVLQGLIKTQCFKVGEFTLKSGKKSPFYIDIRRVSSEASLLRKVGKAYASLIKGLNFDRIAGIPVAGLPLATALSLEIGVPMIYPRMTMKSHGTGNQIEGEYKEGETILLLDDLITTGKSKLEAIEILRSAGLKVVDLIVLIERGAQGRKDMEAAGIQLYSYAQVEEFLEPCHELELIDKQTMVEMIQYAREE
ncbi:MAG: orotidine-5'-phosphate decarboxylase [Spirochaetaceae bacterium]|jgi:uridine monophosphate synthetase|nr:orotidine-5'-phosphate decarboxylase [Spirochaetaceae bacterium]